MLFNDFTTWHDSLYASKQKYLNKEINLTQFQSEIVQANQAFILAIGNPIASILINKVFTKAKSFFDPPLTNDSNLCPSGYSEQITVNLPNIPQPDCTKPQFNPTGKIFSTPAKVITGYTPIPFPDLPIRRLPSSNTTPPPLIPLPPSLPPVQNEIPTNPSVKISNIDNYSIPVEIAAQNKDYGGLLHEPFSSTPFPIPTYIDLNVTDLQELTETSLEQLTNWLISEIFAQEPVLTKATDASLLLTFRNEQVIICGAEALSLITNHNLKHSTNALFPPIDVIYTQTKSVSIDDNDLTALPSDNGFSIVNRQIVKNDEIMIPLRNFKSNQPGYEGYKTQLEIKYRMADRYRILTLPAPKIDLTTEQIQQALPASLYFGDEHKYEMDVTPYGLIRFYGNDKDDEVKTMLLNLAPLIDGTIKENTFRFSKRKRGFINGDYGLYSAHLLIFTGNNFESYQKFTFPFVDPSNPTPDPTTP